MWVFVSAGIFGGAWPEPLFTRVAEPALGHVWGALAVSGLEFTVAVVLGIIGGKMRDWRFTTVGAILMPVAIYVGQLIDGAFGSGFPSVAMSSWGSIQSGAFQ